jgi:hypothetical protein
MSRPSHTDPAFSRSRLSRLLKKSGLTGVYGLLALLARGTGLP